MDKIKKAIAKLPEKYKIVYFFIEQKLLERNFGGLNIIKLKGSSDIYRVKHGKLRIIFRFNSQSLNVLALGFRNEKTYKDF